MEPFRTMTLYLKRLERLRTSLSRRARIEKPDRRRKKPKRTSTIGQGLEAEPTRKTERTNHHGKSPIKSLTTTTKGLSQESTVIDTKECTKMAMSTSHTTMMVTTIDTTLPTRDKSTTLSMSPPKKPARSTSLALEIADLQNKLKK